MFGEGKVDITVQKTSYAPGETISGDVTLALKKPVTAAGLSVSLIGQYKAGEVDEPPKYLEAEMEPKTADELPDLGPKFDLNAEIQGGEVAGEAWPEILGEEGEEEIRRTVHVSGATQQLDGRKEYTPGQKYHFAIKIDEDTPTGPVKWYLLAKLDTPHKPHVSKKVKVTIG